MITSRNNWAPEWTVQWKSELKIYDPMQILEKNHHLLKYLSCHSILGRYICQPYIAWNPIFTFLRHFYAMDFANFAGSTIIFCIAAFIIWRQNCCTATMDLAAAPPEVFVHWQPYLMVSSTLLKVTLLSGCFSRFSNATKSRKALHLSFLGKLFWGGSLRFFATH